MTELNIEQERREFESTHVGANFSRCDQRPSQYANRSIQGRWTTWLAAKRAAVGSAEPVYFIRPHGHVEKRDGDSPCWLEASEDAYDYTLPANRRICYTAPPAPVSAETVKKDQLENP